MLETSLKKSHFISKKSTNDNAISSSFLTRFFHRVGLFRPTTCAKLAGRIEAIRETANKVVAKLESTQRDLERDLDQELYQYIRDVIKPLIREIEKVNLSNQAVHQSVNEQAHALQQYSEWVDKAKGWLTIWKQSHNKELLTSAVITHIIEEVVQSIEKDICLIIDYKRHLLEGLALGNSKRQLVTKKIAKALKPVLSSLRRLERCPEGLDLAAVAAWRLTTCQQRQVYHDEALFIVDHIVDQYQTASISKEEHNHLVDVLQQFIYLEEMIPKLYAILKQKSFGDSGELEEQLGCLEEEVLCLHADLRLTPDLVERLETISAELQKIRGQL